MSKQYWKGRSKGFEESLYYLDGRRKGEIKSLKTPWEKFNDATTDGLEWHSMTVIAGRPGTGKTLIKDQLIRGAFELNPLMPFRVLEFSLEMLMKVSAIREYASVLNKTYKELCSVGQFLPDADLRKCLEYAKVASKYPIDVVEEPCTVEEFEMIIHEYMRTHAFKDGSGKITGYMNTVITLDHSLLLKKGKHEKDKYDTLYLLGETLTKLKRKYPIAFIILSQLNRNVDTPERCENGKPGNYILSSDIFGADALLQHADTVVGINRPSAYNITEYGPDRYLIEKDTLVMHFLKCRNGDNRISFFKSEFQYMRIKEIPPPPTKQRRMYP